MSLGTLGTATIERIRDRMDGLLTDRCDIQRRTHSVGKGAGEHEEVFLPIQENVPCRFLTSPLDTRVALETIGGVAVTDLERYAVALPFGTFVPSAGRLIRGGETFEIVNIRESKTDDAQARVLVTRVREP